MISKQRSGLLCKKEVLHSLRLSHPNDVSPSQLHTDVLHVYLEPPHRWFQHDTAGVCKYARVLWERLTYIYVPTCFRIMSTGFWAYRL